MTIFPDEFEIRVIDEKNRQPVEGIALIVHLFATKKNDYYLYTNCSDRNGNILVTKDMLKNEIDTSISMYIMDYADGLQDCKPYIEIIVKDGKAVAETISWIQRHTPENYKGGNLIFDEGIKALKTLKNCRNELIKANKEVINIEQGAGKQIISFDVKLN